MGSGKLGQLSSHRAQVKAIEQSRWLFDSGLQLPVEQVCDFSSAVNCHAGLIGRILPTAALKH